MRISDWSSDVCSSDLMALEPMTVAVEEGPNPELVDMGRRFWISAVLTLPLFIMAMSDMLPGKPAAGLFAGEAGLWIQLLLATPVVLWRSEERRVGNEWVSTCRSRWSRYN